MQICGATTPGQRKAIKCEGLSDAELAVGTISTKAWLPVSTHQGLSRSGYCTQGEGSQDYDAENSASSPVPTDLPSYGQPCPCRMPCLLDPLPSPLLPLLRFAPDLGGRRGPLQRLQLQQPLRGGDRRPPGVHQQPGRERLHLHAVGLLPGDLQQHLPALAGLLQAARPQLLHLGGRPRHRLHLLGHPATQQRRRQRGLRGDVGGRHRLPPPQVLERQALPEQSQLYMQDADGAGTRFAILIFADILSSCRFSDSSHIHVLP